MTTSNNRHDDQRLDASRLDRALETVSIRLRDNRGEPQEIVVCGGSALILTGAVARTTQDVDIVALASPQGLLSPDPLPKDLERGAAEAPPDIGRRDRKSTPLNTTNSAS